MRHRRPLGFLAAATVAALTLAGCSEDSSSDPSAALPSGSASSDSGSSESGGPTPSESESADTSTDLILDVDLGGRRMHVTCFGPMVHGEPTVLFEAGGGSPSDVWDPVVDAMSPEHRTCSYDRAGIGGSQLPPKPRRTTKDLVADLEAVLDEAEIEGPFLLVGHSMADWPISVFAAAHPEDVAGVVLVDPRGPHVSERWLAALPPASADEPEAVRLNRQELTEFENDPSLNPEHLDVAASAAEASAVLDETGPLFGDVPLIVLSAANTHLGWDDLPPKLARAFDSIWLADQQSLAEESSNGTFEQVADTGHSIQNEQPQSVIDAIESVLAAAAG